MKSEIREQISQNSGLQKSAGAATKKRISSRAVKKAAKRNYMLRRAAAMNILSAIDLQEIKNMRATTERVLGI